MGRIRVGGRKRFQKARMRALRERAPNHVHRGAQAFSDCVDAIPNAVNADGRARTADLRFMNPPL